VSVFSAGEMRCKVQRNDRVQRAVDEWCMWRVFYSSDPAGRQRYECGTQYVARSRLFLHKRAGRDAGGTGYSNSRRVSAIILRRSSTLSKMVSCWNFPLASRVPADFPVRISRPSPTVVTG
jgi:hypothetical protein